MIVKKTGQIVITGACGGRKLRTDLQIFYEGTSNKMAISNSLAQKGIKGRLSVIVVDNEIESVQLQQSTVVLSKKQLKEVLCFTGRHGDMWADVAWLTKYGKMRRHMN